MLSNYQLRIWTYIVVLTIASTLPLSAASEPLQFVIHISVDGLRADAVTQLGSMNLPNFYRLRNEGAYTDNARTDFDETVTLPSHTTQLTGRAVSGADGHNYTANDAPGSATTLHNVKSDYISSVFDVVHDHGLRTALFASKPKFTLYDQSYNDSAGAEDNTGRNDGRDKIDSYVMDVDSDALVASYLDAMIRSPFNYTLLHLHNPDTAGHASNWDVTLGSGYLNSIIAVDRLLGRILEFVESQPTLAGKTALIVTTDHGGRLGTIWHEPAASAENYTIPFYIWGNTVARRTDLYSINSATRADPGLGRPDYGTALQPIRNGDSANLALDLLGIKPIPGSTINALQDLNFAR